MGKRHRFIVNINSRNNVGKLKRNEATTINKLEKKKIGNRDMGIINL